MKTINNNTKKAQTFINAYNRSKIFDIYGAYDKPSTEKTRADLFCWGQMKNEGGHDYRIISYNTFQFTAAWIVGNSLRIETARNSFIIPNVAE